MMQATGPPERATVPRATLGVLLLSLLWVLTAVARPSTAEAAEPPRALTVDSRGVLEIITVPKVAGARFMVDGRIHRADRQGVVRLKVKSLDRHTVAIVDKKISQTDRNLEFDRWYQGNHDKDHLDELSGLSVRRNLRIKAAYRATYRLQYSFVDKARNEVDRTRVSRVEFRGDHGQTVSGNGSGTLTVLGIRPVVTGGTIIAKRVNYTVQRVEVDGSNVVQVNEQRFEPSRKTTVVIPLQLYSVHLSTRDMLFGNPVGQAVWLKYPDGHRFKVPLDADGKATVENLARGSYTVQVGAPGLAFERPLVISRNQYVELQHVSNLDIAVGAAVVAALMLSLYLVRVRGRPAALRPVIRRRDRFGPFGPARILPATRKIPRVKTPTQQLSTKELAAPGVAEPSTVDDEIPTQRISQVAMLSRQLSTQEMVNPEAADHGDIDAEKIDGEKELAADDPDGAQDYRTRIDEAQLPDDVRKAALREVGQLERTSDLSPESGEIRTWLGTILDLPWSTGTSDSIDIQTERAVDQAAADSEKVDTEKVGPAAADMVDGEKVDALAGEIAWPLPPWAADTERVDGRRIDPAAAEVEKPAGPHDDDIEAMSGVLAVHSGGVHSGPQLPDQQVHEPLPVQNPAEKRRVGSPVVSASALAVLLVGTLMFGVSRDGGVMAQSVRTITATSTATGSKPTSVPSDESTDKGGEESAIQLKDLAGSARPFQTVRIQGSYLGRDNTFLRVQRWEAGKWLDFPLPTKTNRSGQFTAYVELGEPGRYQLRVLNPDSGVTSKPFVLVIKG